MVCLRNICINTLHKGDDDDDDDDDDNNNNNNNNNNNCFLKYVVRMWTGFIWLRMGSSSSSGEYGTQPSFSTECGRSSII